MTQAPATLENEIKARAMSLGFSVCGITTADPLTSHNEYVNWVSQGYHADMAYLASPFHLSRRQDPALLFPDLKSIIVLGLSYPLHELEKLDDQAIGLVSGYANGEDYHTRIPRMAEPLLELISGLDINAPAPRVFTDSAPVLERELAVRAGLGWIGRNSCLISPKIGPNLLLAEIFTGVHLKADLPYTGTHCGSCRRCIDACPTGCILPDRKIDASHCLSYHSIENKGAIPTAIMGKFGSWIFGCDICQMVCPWNNQGRPEFSNSQGKALELTVEEMLDLLELSPADFKPNFGKTAISRAGYIGFKRNLIIRLAILGEERMRDRLEKIEFTSEASVLMKTAVWAKELTAKKQSSG